VSPISFAQIRSPDDDGTLQWVKGVGGSSGDRGIGVSSLSDDTTICIGSHAGGVIFGEGEPGETKLTGPGNQNFLAGYRADGNLVWAKQTHDRGYGFFTDISTLFGDSTVVTGPFEIVLTLGEGEPGETTLYSTDDDDMFVARYNPDGTVKWARRAGGPDDVVGQALTALSDDSTVVTGFYNESATFGPGELSETTIFCSDSSNIFIARYEP